MAFLLRFLGRASPAWLSLGTVYGDTVAVEPGCVRSKLTYARWRSHCRQEIIADNQFVLAEFCTLKLWRIRSFTFYVVHCCSCSCDVAPCGSRHAMACVCSLDPQNWRACRFSMACIVWEARVTCENVRKRTHCTVLTLGSLRGMIAWVYTLDRCTVVRALQGIGTRVRRGCQKAQGAWLVSRPEPSSC